ncbi:MAG: DUF4230 domain-containing protein [Zoogloeaceae bacterium]|jgi:hypothetical protein|nr:DUF4230 domain-containing protein [Zoogloeaceae bacterium]
MTHIKHILLLILAIAIVITVFFFIKNSDTESSPFFESKSERSAHTVLKEVLPIGEYASLAYHYSTVVKDTTAMDFNGWTIPFTTSKYIFTYDGIMKLGFDCSKIEIKETPAEAGKLPVIRILLPPIKVLSHEVIDDSVEVYDQAQSVFNEIKIQNAFNITGERKRELEKKVMAGDMVKEAQTSAEQQFGALLRGLPGIRDNYEIVLEWQEAVTQTPAQPPAPSD